MAIRTPGFHPDCLPKPEDNLRVHRPPVFGGKLFDLFTHAFWHAQAEGRFLMSWHVPSRLHCHWQLVTTGRHFQSRNNSLPLVVMVDATKYPTRIAPYGLRMPPELKDRIDAAARANSRSMNAEIVAALEHAFPAPDALGNAISQLGSLNMMKAQAATEDARAAYDLAIKAAVDELARLVHG